MTSCWCPHSICNVNDATVPLTSNCESDTNIIFSEEKIYEESVNRSRKEWMEIGRKLREGVQ